MYLHGDAAFSFDGGSSITGLPLDTFFTARFESRDGSRYTFAVDGRVFFDHVDPPPSLPLSGVQFGGFGGCSRPPGEIMRNEWDFIRYGTLSDGELIVATDPPEGVVDANVHPALDRFTVSFDEPAFVYVDQISVAVSAGMDVPQVLWVRRPDHSEPDTVEVVLDRPLPLNATTTFTFDDGVAESVVEYTYLSLGACCSSQGACTDTDEEDCADLGGAFAPGQDCEGDLDEDGVDELCGDQCPMDPNKLTPGQCGCGMPDTDSDGDGVADCLDLCPLDPDKIAPGLCGCGVLDTDSDGDGVPDCVDQCPGEDDTIDANDDGIPDCFQFPIIPTTTAWGLAVMLLLILIAAKLRPRMIA